jgi:putative tricarboxylic transport membrane protein
MEPVGFFPCAILLVTGLLALLRVRLWIAAVVGVAAASVVHAIFYSGLRVALPWGLLEPFAW